MQEHMSGWTCLLFVVCSSIALGSPVVSKLKEEARSWHTALQENVAAPSSFGLEQLQHASNMVHNMWHNIDDVKHKKEDHIEMPAINFAVAEPANAHATRFSGWSLDEEVDPNELCGAGVANYSMKSRDTCGYYYCSIEEAVCTNGSIVTWVRPNATTINTIPWPQCVVTKITSMLGDDTEIIDLQSQYGVSNCKLVASSVRCIGHGANCYAQITCANFTNFGYNSWGLQCATDKLLCGSVEVPSAKFSSYQPAITNGECSVFQTECSAYVPLNCSRLNLNCGFQTNLGNSGGCQLQRFDVPCAQSTANLTNCNISEILCNGVVLSANASYNNQSSCSIQSLVCDGVSTTMQNNAPWVPRNMSCNGVNVAFSTYQGPLSQCSIRELNGAPNGNCTLLQFSCSDSPKCALEQLPCTVKCQTLPFNTSSCVCPDDFTGSNCWDRQTYNCSASLVYPAPSCLPSPLGDPKDYLLDGDRKCTVYNNYKADANLGYLLDCRFEFPDSVNTSSGNFTYWAKNSKISLSYPVQWAITYKAFNFKQFSDLGVTFNSGSLTAAQILGQDLLWFNFSLSDVPDRFWFARRLYYELRFGPGPNGNQTTVRAFIDAPTRPISTATMKVISTFTKVAIVVGVVVFIALSGYIGYRCYRRYQKQKPKKEKY